ncbi:hypothetical protein MOD25_05535 [Bacillus haynesii]|uniref:hypothetical protein n=1 Tax=Bacillus haynesii TaxID=1925021 RepID=UPI00227F7944|nr:hypothetical protein [Bacillus haynesii]MCY8549363.1 hypothetical protein [Bacillus haynesii]
MDNNNELLEELDNNTDEQTNVKTLSFTVDGIGLTRILLQKYVEDFIENKSDDIRTYACYEFLRTIEDKELEDTIDQYMINENVEAITFEDWEKDCRGMFDAISQTERFKDLVFKYQKRGYGETGCGVIDKASNTFYECKFGEHWSRVMQIVEEKHPRYASPLKLMYATHRIDEHNGVTRDEVEQFILENFELIGEQKSLDEYV